MFEPAQVRQATAQAGVRLLPELPGGQERHHALQADPGRVGRVRQAVGHAAPRSGTCGRSCVGQAGRGAPRPRRDGRPLAGRHDHHRVRHVGLRRQGRRPRAVGPGVHRRRRRGPRPSPSPPRTTRCPSCSAGSPWLTIGGIPTPFVGLFNTGGSLNAIKAPNAPSLTQNFALLPGNLKPPVPATNLAQYGYALDTQTSPSSLALAQGHIGSLAPVRLAARVGAGQGHLADQALRPDVLGRRSARAWTAPPGTTRSGCRSTPAPSATGWPTRRRRCWA